jgi:hypothetical protein
MTTTVRRGPHGDPLKCKYDGMITPPGEGIRAAT